MSGGCLEKEQVNAAKESNSTYSRIAAPHIKQLRTLLLDGESHWYGLIPDTSPGRRQLSRRLDCCHHAAQDQFLKLGGIFAEHYAT